jgi:hypothetical protein
LEQPKKKCAQLMLRAKKVSLTYRWLVPLAGLVWWSGVYLHEFWMLVQKFLS